VTGDEAFSAKTRYSVSMSADEQRVDEKGRITIPESIRDRLGIEAGARVRIAVEDGELVIRLEVSREEFVETMAGVVDAESRKSDAPSVDPEDLKRDWTNGISTE
jgi:AbrB family looped-hinge helix DNA binding protein